MWEKVKKNKWSKLSPYNLFNSIFPSIIISTSNVKILTEILHVCMCWYEVQCLLYTFNTSQFRLIMFQVFNSHVWLVMTIVDSAYLMPDFFPLPSPFKMGTLVLIHIFLFFFLFCSTFCKWKRIKIYSLWFSPIFQNKTKIVDLLRGLF